MREYLERISKLEPRRLALLAAQLQSRLDALERERTEPVAIVGMSCRFPGAPDPEAFWRRLREGTDAIREVPSDRWDVDALYDPDPDTPGKMASRWGGFLDEVDRFDARFFGIAPREAAGMDPQQRLLLELAWEALERGGIAPDRLTGSRTGVFVGIAGSDYSQLQLRAGLSGMDAYSASGNAHSVAAGRLSFVLGLQGPCFPIDTACSSSLVAVHQAVQSLRHGECEMALAGGVNLILSPETSVALSKLRMMAPDGRCKVFDARADGFVRGEGGAVLVLKRLRDAEADGDPVVALIRGSAVNQDGRSNGLTAPNGPAQEAVIRAALAGGGVAPEQVGYVEAHGTGTSLGDPIEVQALASVLGRNRTEPLLVGSVKANVGHLESAAGVAGLVKLVLALQNREIPPQLHVRSLNPHIPWDELPVAVPTTAVPWTSDRPRVGGVSSFGFSGTNAHVVVEEAPTPARREAAVERPVHLLALSARSEAALRELAARVERRLADEEPDLADACFTANAGRAHLAHRVALTARSREEAREALRAVAAGGDSPALHRGVVSPTGRPRVGFLFTGQGSQRVNMGRRLFETQPTFRAVLERCEEILRGSLEHPLCSVLYPAAGEEERAQALLDRTEYTQPALFALEYALSELWRSWGVEPAAALGHSVGEYAAACVAGVFPLEEGLRLVAERGRLMQTLPEGGAMATVFAGVEEAEAEIAPWTDRLSVAAVNGPGHVVVSGEEAALERVREALASRGIHSQRLPTSHAFHSPLTDPVLEPFARLAATVDCAAPRIALASNVTGRMAAPAELADPGYWVRHVRQTVRFAEGVQALHQAGYEHFVEVGPGSTLLSLGRRCIPAGGATWLPSLRPGRDDWDPMLDALASLYARGVEVDWRGFDRDYPRRRVLLPTYPFERERHWSVAAPRVGADDAGVRAPDAAPPAADPASDPLDRLLYEIAWLPAGRAVDPGDGPQEAPPFPAPPEVAARVAPRVAELSAAHGMEGYDALLPQLDAVAAASILSALGALGWRIRFGDETTTTGLAERLGIVPRHRRLLHRLLAILAEEGVVRRSGEGWKVTRVPVTEDPVPRWAALRRAHPAFDTELQLVARCAGALPGVLRGEVDPLQLLFPGGSLDDAERLYQETPVARTYNALVGEAVATATGALPEGRTLRVLEIGAGTGGTTSSVLPALPPGRTEYVFTDVSPLFTGRASEKFRAYPFVRYEVLDITRDPQAQGFAPGAFDLVLAANVLHATPDLRSTLAHVRQLLAPEGMLVLYEAMAPQRFSDLTVGLTEGWWAFTDHDLRPDYALLPHRRWRELLSGSGFTGATVLPDEQARGILAQQAVVLARATAERSTAPDEPVEGRPPWLVFADTAGTGRRLAAALRERGEGARVVTSGAAYRQVADDEIQIDPTRPEQFERVLAEDAAGWRGVAYLWGLDARLDDDATPAELVRGQRHALGGALHLVQGLARVGGAPPVWLVTRGAQPAGESSPGSQAAQASLWGLGHTIALEHPELRCTRIDLNPEGDGEAEAATLAAQLLRPDPAEDQVALRGGERRVRRLVRAAPPAAPAEPVRFPAESSYLVTGGLRGIGLRVAEWMVERGARHLVLVGRSGASPAARAAVRRLEEAGARVVVAAGDVSDRARLAGILAEAERSLPPLRGVIHSAGVLDDGVLVQQGWPRFETVLAPKVAGSWNLHALTRDVPLDFMVLFSSGVGLLGAAGQGNHAAANAFLDALAFYRRAQGLPAVTINWGAWAEIGAAADHGLAERGTETFSPAEGLRALERALQDARLQEPVGGRGRVQLAVLAADWESRLASFAAGGEPPVFREIAREVRAGADHRPTRPPERRLPEKLAAAAPNRRISVLQEHVRHLAARVLDIGDAQTIDPRQPLQELGLDSLMAIEMRNRLGQDVERALPATLLFEYPTVAALTAYLAAETLSLQPEPAPSPDPARDEARPEAIPLSEADLAALLLKKIEHIETRR